MTHVIDLMSTRTSADFCVEGKKIKRSCHHSGPHRLPLGAGLWPAGRGLHMPAIDDTFSFVQGNCKILLHSTLTIILLLLFVCLLFYFLGLYFVLCFYEGCVCVCVCVVVVEQSSLKINCFIKIIILKYI